ncbi:MAG: T9SS type A sorting domain-containing protein [Bacteroidetes bacterium]|nr:T9SS type A sorting domain-containing protein [Bacteroidota bacterium]
MKEITAPPMFPGEFRVRRAPSSSGCSAGGSGNSDISFTYNTIRDRTSATGVPANMFFSYNNTPSTANNTITIQHNDIFNFSQTGVYLPDGAGNGNNWNISDNNFYCTADMSSYQSSVPQHIAIYLKASSSHSHTIKRNSIGGQTINAGGSAWLNSNSSLDFEGIRLEIGGSTSGQETKVDSNIIKNINLTGTGLSMFMGIRVKTGLVDIGGNTIGDLSATISSPSIQVAGSGTANGSNDNVSVFAIWNYSTSASTIANNVIAGIKNTGGYSYMTGIRRGAREYGTNALNVYAGKSIITANTIANLWSETSMSNVFLNGQYVDKVWPGALTGIALRSNYGRDNRVDSNTVYGLKANATWNRWVRVNGIALNAETSADAGVVSKNRISDLENYNGGVSGTNVFTPAISGIAIGASDLTAGNSYVANGSYTLINNMIYLAPAVFNSTKPYNNPDIYGILDVTQSGNTTKYFYNSIYISGAGKSSLPGDCPVVPSYGYMRSASGNGTTQGGTVYLKNNIIINNRTGYVKHFAIGNNTSTPTTGWSGSNIDYNFFSTGNTSTVGQRISGNFQTQPSYDYTFSGWQSYFSADANSKFARTTVVSTNPSSYTNTAAVDSVNPRSGYLFEDLSDIVTAGKFMHIALTDGESSKFIDNNGTDVSSYATVDFDEEARNGTTPDIGADEIIACAQPTVTLDTIASLCYSTGTQIAYLNYTATTNSPDQYSIVWGAPAITAGFADSILVDLTATPIVITVPASAAAATYSGTLTVKNSSASCTSTNYTISLKVNSLPTITLGSNPSVCYSAGVQTADLTYSATTQSPIEFSVDWDVAAEAAGFTDVHFTSLPALQIGLSVPAGAAVATYNGTLNVRNADSCMSIGSAISVTINATPVITKYSPISFVNTVCEGSSTWFEVVAASGGPMTFNWIVSLDSGSTWSAVVNSTPYSLTSTNHNNLDSTRLSISNSTPDLSGNQYKCIVTGACSPPDTSDIGYLNVFAPPSFSSVSNDTTICLGGGADLGAAADGGGLIYHWQYYNGSTWANVNTGTPTGFTYNNSNSPNLSITTNNVTTSPGSYQFRLNATNLCNPSPGANSSAITVTVLSSTIVQWIGGISNDWHTAGNWCPGIPTASTDVTILSGRTYQPVITANAYSHHLTIANNTSVTIQPHGHLFLHGDLTVNGAYTHNAGILELTGNAPQTISPITADSVIVNNATGVTLGGNLLINSHLSLIEGVINTGMDTVVILDTLTTALDAGNDTSYIYGFLRRAVGDTGLYHFPVGYDVHYQLASVRLHNNTGRDSVGINELTAYFNPFSSNVGCSDIAPGNGLMINGTLVENLLNGGFWTIHPDTVDYSLLSYDITLRERAYTNAPTDPNRVGVVKRGECSDAWTAPGTHVNSTQAIINHPTIPARNTVVAAQSALSHFSDFGMGFGGVPLPVELIYLEAEAMDNSYIQVRWATAVEINNYGFDVERSTDGASWTKVSFVNGHNNSTIQQTYQYDDREVVSNVRYYYRLKQMDYNGDFKHTDMVTAILTSTTTFEVLDLVPNPTASHTTLQILSSKDQEITVDIYNIVGQKVLSRHHQIVKGQNNNIDFQLSILASGTYSVMVSSANEVYVKKLVITR